MTLEELYQRILDNTSNGTLNFIPGVLSTDNIADFYRQFAVGGSLVITKSTSTPPTDGKVVVAGLTPVFGLLETNIHLTFTEEDGKVLKSEGVYEMPDLALGLPSVPWFSIGDPAMTFLIGDDELLVSGNGSGTLKLGSTTVKAKIDFPATDDQWLITAAFEESAPSLADFFQLAGGINLAAALPSPINAFADLRPQQLTILFDSAKKRVNSMGLLLGTEGSWHLFGKVTLKKFTILCTILSPGDLRQRGVAGTISSNLKIGDGMMDISITYPNVAISGALAADSPSPTISDVITMFAEDLKVPIGGNVSRLSFSFSPTPPTVYSVGCGLVGDWPIVIGGIKIFTITGLSLDIQGIGKAVTGSFAGTTTILPDSANIGLQVRAAYDGPEAGWTFEGSTTTPISIGQLLKGSPFHFDAGSQAGYNIDRLSLIVATGDNSWTFDGAISDWKIDFLGLTIKKASVKAGQKTEKESAIFKHPALRGTTAALLAAQDGKDKVVTFAEVEADLDWLGIEITTWIKFGGKSPSWGFTWKQLTGEVAQNEENKEWIGTLKFDDNVTLGSMIEDMVSWISGSRFGLEAPWNFLNSIPLSNLSLIYNFTKKTVAFGIDIGPIDIGFARIDSIQVSYGAKANDPNNRRGVMVSLKGSFPWNIGENANGDSSTLGPWDASQPGSAPAPSGNGNKYLDLRLLAMGQHVHVTDLEKSTTVQEAIALMEKLPDPVSDPPTIPPITFDAQSAWLFGTDFGVLRLDDKKNGGDGGNAALVKAGRDRLALLKDQAASNYFMTLQIVFNDPHFYALRIALAGEPAKILKGLDFQILYRQISDTVGVYQSEITLPDVMRHLSIGAYSITLPVFGIAVYTNGDFQVDVGFPWNSNFARSFTIEGIIYPGIPVLGSAGFYFGKLSSATTNRVPQTTLGTFNPVIVFGFGLQVGFGKSIEYGILKAGFSLTVVGILEGVIAKWNPFQLTDGGNSSNSQIQGAYYFWLQGTVGIVGKLYGSVDFAIIKASVNVELKLLLQLTYESYVSISVTVIASVDVSASVDIDLGLFTISIHFSFSMRLKETFTMLNSGQAPWQVGRGARGVLQASPNHRLQAARRAPARLPLAAQAVALNWANLEKPAAGPALLSGYLAPALTVARDEWTAQPDLSTQVPCYVAGLFIESTAPTHQDSHSSGLKAAGNQADTSFETLSKMVLRWAIASLQQAPLNADQVDQLIITTGNLEILNEALVSTDAAPTPIPQSAVDSFLNNQFRFAAQVPPKTVKQSVNATYFPMAPQVKLAIPAYGKSYPGYSYTFGGYNSIDAAGLKELRHYFDDLAVQVRQEMQNQPLAAAAAGPNATFSMSDWIYTDYFLLLARQMVQAASDALRNFKYPITSGQTASQTVDWINTTGQLTGGDSYTLSDLFAANQTHMLNTGSKLTIGVTQAVGSGETFNQIAIELFDQAFAPGDLALANAANRQILQPGAVISFPDKPAYTVKAGDTLISIAGIFGCQVSELVINARLLEQKGLLAPQSLLVLPLVRYQSQASDSFQSIAQQAVYAGAFDAKALATQNAGLGILRVGAKVEYAKAAPGTSPYVVRARDCLGDVANYFKISLDELFSGTNILSQSDLLAPVAVLFTPPFTAQSHENDTLQTIASRYATTVNVIAENPANGAIADLFATTNATQQPDPYLDVPHLAQFLVGELIAECQRSLALQHLSSMTSRYYLHGLRLPTAHIQPLQMGMWVKPSGDGFELPEFAGLYALTGQQFPLPTIDKQDFTITFDNSAGPAWLQFTDNQKPTNQLKIQITPDSDDAKRIAAVTSYAQKNRLEVTVKQLGPGAISQSDLATYPFTSARIWQSAAPVTLPYGPSQSGIPSLRLWTIPDAMLTLPAPSLADTGASGPRRLIDPRFKLQVARYEEASGATQQTDISNYGWASVVEFTVKRIPAVATSPASATTYEIAGAGGNDIVLLERLIAAVGSNESYFEQVLLAYAPEQSGNASSGIQTDAPNQVTMGIAQVDLSTVTRPPAGFAGWLALADDHQTGLLNSMPEFMRLLWEASITRSGGFYLYYYNADTGAGLPDRIFNDKNEATLTLIVLYSQPAAIAAQNNLTSFMNAVATGDAIDTGNSVLFAQADPPARTIVPDGNASLAAIAYGYYSDIGELAQQNSQTPLAAGRRLVVDQGLFQAPTAGMSLAAIAQQFSTQATPLSVADLQKANPRAPLSDPLVFPAAINLPPITVTVGADAHGSTLGEIARFYGEDLTALSATNQDVEGIFAATQQVTIPGGPVARHASVPPGVVSVEAVRPVPPKVPLKPEDPDYAKNFLLNLYTLLSYRIADNAYFKTSNLGLPIGPTTQPADPGNAGKIRLTRQLTSNDVWQYKQSLPYPKFRKTAVAAADLPLPGDSPYLALGSLLQVNYEWQDHYGNRLVTTLSDPKSGDQGPFNQAPLLTGYTDAIINLTQWPSVSSSWHVIPQAKANPQLELLLSFDASKYQGLLEAKPLASGTQIVARFTQALDPATATDTGNYKLDNNAAVSQATLSNDGMSVTLTTTQLGDARYTLTVRGIKTADLKTTFSGDAGFDFPDNPDSRSSTVQGNALQDLRVYTQLFYQLSDPNGIAYSIESTLLETQQNPQGTLLLNAAQIESLQNWLFYGSGSASSIYAFLQNRSQFKADVAQPPALTTMQSALGQAQINPAEIFELSLSFTIERTSGMVAGELQTTSNVRQSSVSVSPRIERITGGNGQTVGLTQFAQDFQDALSVKDAYRLKIATGVDRDSAGLSRGASTLWAARVGWTDQPISYQITPQSKGNPQIFAPQPVSNQLRSDPVEIYDYTTGKGISPNPTRSIDFVDIDVDVWMQHFFSAMDGLLTPQFTAAMQIVGEKKNHDYLNQILQQKKTLAGIAKRLMIPAFQGEIADPAAAQEAFYQQMLTRLSNAYNTRAAIQFAAAVQADIAHAPGYPPQLFGNIVLNKISFPAGDDPSGESGESRVTFTSPKLALETNPEQPLAFLLSAPDTVRSETGAVVPSVRLDLEYNGTSIEHQIGPVPGIEDYRASTWLSFVVRDDDWSLQRELGEFSVPMFLRAFPASPSVTAQEGDATYPGVTDLSKVTRWNYACTYSLPFHYPQDTVYCEVEFNVRRLFAAPDFKDAFPQLAQFTTVFPEVNKDLENILAAIDAAKQDRIDDAEIALKSFCDLVNGVILAANGPDQRGSGLAAGGTDERGPGLAMLPPRKTLAGNSGLTYNFRIEEGYVEVGGQRALLVSLVGQPPAGIGAPAVLIDRDHYESIPYTKTDSDCDQPGHFCFVYKNIATGLYLSDADGQRIPDRHIVLPDMDILERQDAWSTVYLKRNERLVPGKLSAEPFIYRTPNVQFANALHPVIDSDIHISLADILATSSKRSLLKNLEALFQNLFTNTPPGQVVIQVEVSYEYSINSSVQPVPLPVFMQAPLEVTLPEKEKDPVELEKMIADWEQAIELWFTTHLPDGLEGTLWFDLTIMSNLTAQPMPLLRLRKLYLPIGDLEPPLPTEPALERAVR